MKIKKAQFAGSFYPSDPLELAEMVDGYISNSVEVELPKGAKLKAIIVPHAGYEYSGIVAGAGYKIITNYQLPITKKTIILLGPSHNEYFKGVVTDESDYWENLLGRVPVSNLCHLSNLGSTKDEHSLEVQIPFLQRALGEFEIVPILTGEIEAEDLSDRLLKFLKLLKDEKNIIIVSSDLSHYYPYDEAVRIDRTANEAIPALDIERVEKKVEACGKTGILAIMHLAKKLGWKGMFLDYKNSGDTAGDKTRVVGYGCYGFYEL